MARKFTPAPTHYKILLTVSLLNQKHYYPLPEGVYKILNGIEDRETMPFSSFPSFQSGTSFSSKKICRYIMMLCRYQYLAKIYDEKTGELYLGITPLGKKALAVYLSGHPNAISKKEITPRPTIVKISQF